jgi:hypothetical protein
MHESYVLLEQSFMPPGSSHRDLKYGPFRCRRSLGAMGLLLLLLDHPG